jgi:Na+(H+)/acetate symporter ActP
MPTVALQPIACVVMLAYFAVVLGVGLWMRRAVHTSDDLFTSGRSLPAWVSGLRLRFDEKTRGFNAISFAAMTVFSSGVPLSRCGRC